MFRTFVILLVVIVGSIYGASTASGGSSATTKVTPTATPTGTRATTQPTTTSPFLTCYECGGLNAPCPDPFPSNGGTVSVAVVGRPAYCAKILPGKSTSNPAVRFADLGTQCNSNGCRSSGSNTVCCCDRDRCNAGLLSSQITFSLMFVALAFLAFFQ